jgi:CDP-diacylglycerol--glycerol-3-phosphate 3-phosphatidyltransferase
MVTIYQLKPAFQNLLRPVCRFLASVPVTANQVTLSALLLSVIWGSLIALFNGSRWPLFGLPLVLFVRMALNAIDGMLAREHGMKSSLGAILNEVGDVVSDAALYLPLAVVPGVPVWPMVLAVLLSVISEMTGVVALQIGASRRYDGPMGKSDRAFGFSVLALWLAFRLPVDPWVALALWLIAGLLVLTILNRAKRALKELGPA